jgi:hypothetical protein
MNGLRELNELLYRKGDNWNNLVQNKVLGITRD